MLATIGILEAEVLIDSHRVLEIAHQDHDVIDTLSHGPPPPHWLQAHIRGTPTDYHEWSTVARPDVKAPEGRSGLTCQATIGSVPPGKTALFECNSSERKPWITHCQ